MDGEPLSDPRSRNTRHRAAQSCQSRGRRRRSAVKRTTAPLLPQPIAKPASVTVEADVAGVRHRVTEECRPSTADWHVREASQAHGVRSDMRVLQVVAVEGLVLQEVHPVLAAAVARRVVEIEDLTTATTNPIQLEIGRRAAESTTGERLLREGQTKPHWSRLAWIGVAAGGERWWQRDAGEN